ncbi:MAG: hypothetical protein V2B19_12310 [Pseudomonadota bacterium]
MELLDIDEISDLIGRVDFEDAYIKEAYYIAPTYFTSESIVAPDSPGNFKLLLITNDGEVPALEFEFEEVTQIALSNCIDIEPKIWKTGSSINFSLISSEYEKIVCKQIKVRSLDESFRLKNQRYGKESFLTFNGKDLQSG